MRTYRVVLLALGFAACSPVVLAQDKYPSQPLKLMVPFGPGGVGDTTARIVAEKLGDKIGQRVVIENNPGGGGVAAARAVITAPADGLMLAMLSNGTAISVPLFKSLPFDPLKDFEPVSRLGSFEFFVATGAESAHKTMAQAVQAAKANPAKLNIGAINPGSSQHLTALLLRSTAGADITWVPFKSSPDLVVAVLRGDVDLAIDAYVAIKPSLDDGKIRALATTSPKKSALLPDVPTVASVLGTAFDVTSWNGIYVKSGTAKPIVATLNKALGDVLAEQDTKAKLLTLGIVAESSTPEELDQLMRRDIDKWRDVIDKNNIERR